MPRTLDLTLPDLTGRRALITGASDGIGLQIAHRLARAGAELVLPVRNQAKGEAASAAIRERMPNTTVSLHTLDLSSLDSVAAFGTELRNSGVPIHLMINNAGLMHPPALQRTADGFEMQFGTNYLGHAALVGHLLPLLRAGSARVVNQTSISARTGRIDWDDLNATASYNVERSYRNSKIAVGLLGVELQRRSDANAWGITSTVSHPGVAPTSLLAARPELGRSRDTLGVRVIRALSRRGILFGTPESAALPAVLAATHPAPRAGMMFGPTGPGSTGGAPGMVPLFRPLRRPGEAERLWQRAEELTGVRIG